MLRLYGLLILSTSMMFATQSAQGAMLVYTAQLSGPAESPPNASPGTGFAEVDIDTVAHTLRVRVTFSGLLGNTTASHIHGATGGPFAGTAGVATTTPTFPGFPLGVKSGSFDNTFNLTSTSSYNPAYITAHGGTTAGAEAALLATIAANTSYLNIHTSVVPGGEIRGFLVLSVPEPSSVIMLGLGGIGALAYGRRRMGQPRVIG